MITTFFTVFHCHKQFKSIMHPHNTFFVVAELQHLAVTQGLRKVFKDTQWTVEPLSFEVGHKSVSASAWHGLLLKFGVSKEERVNISLAPTESVSFPVCLKLHSLCSASCWQDLPSSRHKAPLLLKQASEGFAVRMSKSLPHSRWS